MEEPYKAVNDLVYGWVVATKSGTFPIPFGSNRQAAEDLAAALNVGRTIVEKREEANREANRRAM